MSTISKGFALRVATVAAALVVGPATLAPGTAEAPSPSRAALAGDGATAAMKYRWGPALWDFAWEFGESLDSPSYKGGARTAGWTESTDGTGRVVKYGGGIEFQSGDKSRGSFGPDHGNMMLTLHDLSATTGRWEIKEKAVQDERGGTPYGFVIELIPADSTIDPCTRSITIAQVEVGNNSLRIGATGGATKWTKTFASGYPQDESTYNFAVQITKRRVTWFANGQAIASTAAAGARPTVPMTVRLRMLGDGAKEMRKTTVKVDWARGYNLAAGTVPPNGAALTQGANRC